VVSRTPEEVVAHATAAPDLPTLDAGVVDCFACPRLVAWREKVAAERRASFRDQDYWGRPIPGYGPADARIGILGLAPAAHGGNRTGRIFTGDRSGDVLFAAMYRAGLTNQPTSVSRDDGLVLHHTRVFPAVRCAPPDNKPLPEEITRCLDHLDAELAHLPRVRVVVALGKIGFDAWLQALKRRGVRMLPKPQFGHGIVTRMGPDLPVLVGCYHPSRQNTNTGKLTARMMEAVFKKARRLIAER
jgi:uracil-DNA glycosylase